MKKTSLIAALILMWSGAAYAQEAAATDSEAVASETTNAQPVSEPANTQTAEPANTQTTTPPMRKLVMESKRGNYDADARECLQLTANDQIHRCAEKYRTHFVKAAKTSTAEKTKQADALKLEASKSLEVAKTDVARAVPVKSAQAPADKAAPGSSTTEMKPTSGKPSEVANIAR